MRLCILALLTLITHLTFGQSTEYQRGLAAFEAEDYGKAFEVLMPFAGSGDALAEFVIGLCYANSDFKFKSDSLAELYLLKSAEKLNSTAMTALLSFYFRKAFENKKFKILSVVWAEIAGSYDPVFNLTTTRFLSRSYLDQNELNEAEQILKDKKNTFDKISLDAFYAYNKLAKSNNENSEKAKIPSNNYGLIENPYSNWVNRWKFESFECDTMYYTAQIEPQVIDSTVNRIRSAQSFQLHYLYRGENTVPLTLSSRERDYLIKELEALKGFRWPSNMFSYSKCLEHSEVQATLDITENLPTKKEKNMCSIVYTFSKPIFLRNNTIALYLDQERYRGNYTQLNVNFHIFENNRWELLATAYKYYESR